MSNTRSPISALPPNGISAAEKARRLQKLDSWSEEPARNALGEEGAGKGAPPVQEQPPAPSEPVSAPWVAAPVAVPPKSMHARMPMTTYELLRELTYRTGEPMNDIIARGTLNECKRILHDLERKKK